MQEIKRRDLEMGRDTRRGKKLCLVVKCWLRVLQFEKKLLVRECCE
jgi:hypothetical protein